MGSLWRTHLYATSVALRFHDRPFWASDHHLPCQAYFTFPCLQLVSQPSKLFHVSEMSCAWILSFQHENENIPSQHTLSSLPYLIPNYPLKLISDRLFKDACLTCPFPKVRCQVPLLISHLTLYSSLQYLPEFQITQIFVGLFVSFLSPPFRSRFCDSWAWIPLAPCCPDLRKMPFS